MVKKRQHFYVFLDVQTRTRNLKKAYPFETRSKGVRKAFFSRSLGVRKGNILLPLGYWKPSPQRAPKRRFLGVSKTAGLEIGPGWWTDAWDFSTCNSICSMLWKFKRIKLQITSSRNHKLTITCWTIRLCSSEVSHISNGMPVRHVLFWFFNCAPAVWLLWQQLTNSYSNSSQNLTHADKCIWRGWKRSSKGDSTVEKDYCVVGNQHHFFKPCFPPSKVNWCQMIVTHTAFHGDEFWFVHIYNVYSICFFKRAPALQLRDESFQLGSLLGDGHILAQQPVELQWACERGHNMRWYGGYGPTGEPQLSIQRWTCSCDPGPYIEYQINVEQVSTSSAYIWWLYGDSQYVHCSPLSSRDHYFESLLQEAKAMLKNQEVGHFFQNKKKYMDKNHSDLQPWMILNEHW